ncbi:GtrA family protein, partial [Patescibacteria group bacterium]|nr:GtrA family protein [Patescibacteria group bacterium]
LGVLLYYLILYILTDVAGMWYMISAVIASVVNYGSNFVLQKFWTFRNKKTNDIHRQAFKYAIMVTSLFLANLLFLYMLVEYARLWYLVAQVIATILLTIISYLVSRRIFIN